MYFLTQNHNKAVFELTEIFNDMIQHIRVRQNTHILYISLFSEGRFDQQHCNLA